MENKLNLKAGDYIVVKHAGEEKKARFLKYKADQTSMHLHVNGGLRWYPIDSYVGMAKKESIAEMVAKKDKKAVHKIKDESEKPAAPIKEEKKAKKGKTKPTKPVKVKPAKEATKKEAPAPKKLKVVSGEATVPLPKRTADLLRAGKHTIPEIAELIGKSKAYVSNVQSFMRNPEHWKFKH